MSQKQMTTSELLPNYTLEIPSHLQHLLLAGGISGIVGIILIVVLSATARLFGGLFLVVGLLAVAFAALLWLVTNNNLRLSARRKMMNAVTWRGDEMVLDVGCGNGFLMLEAAKHLTTGKAIGVDVWQEDAGGQTGHTTWQNARLEGVANKVDVQNVDARTLPFETGTFDVIMSSLALHHMGSNADRERAVQEMMRVLKPGGTVLLYDMFPITNHAEAVMRQNGWTHIQRRGGFVMRVMSAKQ
jgi:arsenite methyltransferase